MSLNLFFGINNTKKAKAINDNLQSPKIIIKSMKNNNFLLSISLSLDLIKNRKYAITNKAKELIMESILIDAPCITARGKQAMKIKGIFNMGVFLTAYATIDAYNTKLQTLPSHNIQIVFKSKIFAKNIPIA